MKRKEKDEDFVPTDDQDELFEGDESKKSSRNTNDRKNSFLSQNKDFIWKLHFSGCKPHEIATSLCTSKGLPKEAIVAKNVANWINYQKKSGKHGTRPVSLKNGNLRVDFSDNWQDDARKISKQDGEALQEDEANFIDDSPKEYDEEMEQKMNAKVAKILRYFAHSENDTFALFVETGLNRKISCQLVNENTEIELKVTIPIPPDELIQLAGYHAATMQLEPTEENIHIQAPSTRKFSSKNKSILKYPSKEAATWIIFKYDLEVEKEEEILEVDVDLTKFLPK
jgi:hypothetical protein